MSDIQNNNKLFVSNELLKVTFIKDFVPLALTTTLLAPLNRLKICLQTMNMIAINEVEKTSRPFHLFQKLTTDQGLFSLWRGNLSNLYKQFIISYSNILIYQRIKNNFDLDHKIVNKISANFVSSFCSLIFYYPIELANTRITADMTRYGHKKIYNSVSDVFSKLIEEESLSRNSLFNNLSIIKMYKGFSIAILSNFIYWTLTISNFDRLNNYFEKKRLRAGADFEYYLFLTKMTILFGASTLNAIIANIFVYPLDTFKRHLQVTGSLGYKSEYSSGNLFTHFRTFSQFGLNAMYRGFSVNVMKTIPLGLIHYTLYSNSQNLI